VEDELRSYVEGLLWPDPPLDLQHVARLLGIVLPGIGKSAVEFLGKMSDETLVLAIQQGFFAAEAFEALFEPRYHDYFQRWCVRWHVQPQDADDLWQDLLMYLRRRGLTLYQPRGTATNFRRWLYTAALRRWRGLLRKAKRQQQLGTCPEPSSNGHAPEELAGAAELEERLQAAIDALDEPERSVVRAHLAGSSPQATADALQLPLPRVYARLHSARNRIERALGLDPRNPGEEPPS
jgi:RNA polymerase sigma factor (sigma-70 family)